ncbi:MAG: hypothetical protein CFE44_22235 [Burkholderiales bacterium PBB4]|nr:MAG: hypothetical protein CFE44_22235 [Burkholderiales bacterium PBB4]
MMMAFDSEDPQPGARIAMSEAVRAAFGKLQSSAEIQTVVECLEGIRIAANGKSDLNEVEIAAGNLVPRLRAFLDCPARGQFFRGKGTINISKQFTVFEMAGLSGDDHLRKCVMFFVLNMLMTRLKTVKGRKLVLVDEAHDLFKDQLAASVMEGIYLKGRKDAVGVFVIIQSLLKFAKSPAGQVILNQSAWKLILAQEQAEVEKLFSEKVLANFSDDPFFNRLVGSVETRKGVFSEILFVGRRYYEVARLYVDKFTATMFSSEGDARDLVFELMEQGIPAVDAVHQVMGDKSHSRKQLLQLTFSQLQFEDPSLTKADLMAHIAEMMQ